MKIENVQKKYFFLPMLIVLLASSVFFPSIGESNADEVAIDVVQDNEEGIVLEVSAAQYAVKPAPIEAYQTLIIEGYGIYDVNGSPGIVVRGQLVEIPEGSDIELSVESLEKIDLHDFLLAPVPYRELVEDDSGAKKIKEHYRIDTELYAANAFFPGQLASVAFTGYMRDRAIANIRVYPAQYNPVAKTLEIHTKFRVHIKYVKKDSKGYQTAQDEGISHKKQHNRKFDLFKNIYKNTLLNYSADSDEMVSPLPEKTAVPAAMQSLEIETSPYAVRLTIQDEGIYKISYEDLTALGITLTNTTNENLKVENQGIEIPLYRSGTGSFKPGDYILFYGSRFKSLYAKKNVYWLYQGSTDGKNMTIKDGSQFSGYPVQTTFKNSYRGEEDKRYWQSIPNIPDGIEVDHWFWEGLQPTETTIARATFTVPLNNIVKTSGSYSMKVNLRGETALGHHTKVYVNGTQVKDFTWSGQVELTENILDISPSLFINGNNSIRIEEILDPGVTVDRIYINWFEIDYIDAYVAENDILKFTGEGAGNFAFEVKNFTNNTIWLFDVTDPMNALQIKNPQIISESGSYTVKFGDTLSGSPKKYYTTTTNQFKSPDDLTVDEPSALKTTREDVDYIIITHENFYDDIMTLKEYRTQQGLNVEIAKIQDIYDEFSYGIKDAHAIKEFLAYAYNNWNASGHPTFVLLVGDASIDYRDDTGNFIKGNVDFVPTSLYQSYTLGDTPTDNWFACVQGSDPIPDMIMGRLCVKTSQDTNNIIEKIKTYEAGTAGLWTKRVIFAADQGGEFERVSNKLASLLPENFTAEKVYLSTYGTVQQATTDLVNKINAGSLITNYTGHGSVDNWAGEFLFHTPDDKDSVPRNDVERLSNGDRLTFVMTLNCLNGFFPNFLDQYSLAEEFMRAQGKGAIACLAPTGLGFTSEHEVLADKVFNGMFNDGDAIAGSVVYSGKINAYNQIQSRDILETFTFFGDPATELKISNALAAITLLSPDDNAALPQNQRPTFSWEDDMNLGKYKVDFSPDPSFGSSRILRLPLLGFALTSEFMPRFFPWLLLKIMCNRNGQIYWRVAGYDQNNELVGYSKTIRVFTILK